MYHPLNEHLSLFTEAPISGVTFFSRGWELWEGKGNDKNERLRYTQRGFPCTKPSKVLPDFPAGAVQPVLERLRRQQEDSPLSSNHLSSRLSQTFYTRTLSPTINISTPSFPLSLCIPSCLCKMQRLGSQRWPREFSSLPLSKLWQWGEGDPSTCSHGGEDPAAIATARLRVLHPGLSYYEGAVDERRRSRHPENTCPSRRSSRCLQRTCQAAVSKETTEKAVHHHAPVSQAWVRIGEGSLSCFKFSHV